jgi:hypothetical protein
VQTANRLNAAKSRVSVTSAACGSYQISGSILDRSFGRLSGVAQPLARLNALASRFICQSPRAICSALKIQSSLDGIPHRAQRSQSPQAKSVDRCKDRSTLVNLLKPLRRTVTARIFSPPMYPTLFHSVDDHGTASTPSALQHWGIIIRSILNLLKYE